MLCGHHHKYKRIYIYKNNTLEPSTKKLNKQVYSLQKQCSFPIFLIGTGIDIDIGIAKSGSNLVHSPTSHILCLTPCVKSRKSFHGVLPCLVMMYHQTNLDCKSFNISEDLVETIVVLTLNIAKWYFWIILWLMMMHHHIKFDRSEILSGQTFTEVQNLHCDLFWGDQLSLTVHVNKLKCLVKRLLCCIQGQGHSKGSELQWMFARTIYLIGKT